MFQIVPQVSGALTVSTAVDMNNQPVCNTFLEPECWYSFLYVRGADCLSGPELACNGIDINTGVNKLTGKGNIFKGIASEAIDAAEHHDTRLTQQVPLHEWIDNVMARAVGRINNALTTSLPFLATTGSTAGLMERQ